ncbi:MAG: DUF3857 domain-containing protein [Sphingobacteriaceae bacterium]|nr:MAG: DUF3857 domain-containing protein [Sphingobacteriaceae bacterium]
MRRYFLLACLIWGCIDVYGQANYRADAIPKELLPYAGAVVRSSEFTTEVKDFDNTVYHIKRVVTVLNKNGDDEAEIVVWHNKSNTIRYIKGIIYNEFGDPVGKISEKNFVDVHAINSFSLFEDSKVKHFEPAVTTYPYTIEYEYEIRSKQSMIFYDWQPIPDVGVAVEKSRYTFICKPDFKIRYKAYNSAPKAVEAINQQGMKTYTWEMSGIRAYRGEPYSPSNDKFLPMIRLASQTFTYEGINGSYTNWNQVGKWTYDKLLLNRDALLPETVAKVKEITAGIIDPKLKAKKIYEYMQNRTRYISIQIGIGGYQPALASEVDRLKYGDCKGLVNYTQALLKAVNIESYYCVVEAGREKVSLDADFASAAQGNHIILCLPFKNDTTFLECTSQKEAFGFLGDFTDDRLVLACTPTGGKLLRTPKYAAGFNLQTRKAVLTLDTTGLIKGNMQTLYKGTQYDNMNSIIAEQGAEREKEYKKSYTINNFEIEKLKLEQDKGMQPVTTDDVTFNARSFAAVNNGSLTFMPNLANQWKSPLRGVRNRNTNVDIKNGFTDEDEIIYTVPEGYKLVKQPLLITIDKPFGKYMALVTLNGNKLTYKRYIQLIEGVYSKDTYAELVSFYQSVVDHDGYSVILSNKE